MSSSTEKEAANVITTCAACDKESNCSVDNIAAKRLTRQIEDLSIENEGEGGDNIENITTCANCGKGGDKESMNTCNKCMAAKYCNAACKKKHRHKHKKSCEKRVAELHDEALFKEPPPPDDCPICFLPLPDILGERSVFKPCCGKLICDGCLVAMVKESMRKGKPIDEIGICAFCRAPPFCSDEENLIQILKLTENGNSEAFSKLANYYSIGDNGLPQNRAKANELWLKAGELGCAEAYFNLGNSYYHGRGVESDKKKGIHYYELAAMNGDAGARNFLGRMEVQAGNHQRAMKHMIISARAGHKPSLANVKKGFIAGIVTKDEYESTLRAYQKQLDEMKSDTREVAAAISDS